MTDEDVDHRLAGAIPPRNQTNAEPAQQPAPMPGETSKYVTVFEQLKDDDTHEKGDRYISLGREYDDRYRLNDNEFEPVARPIAVIFAGVEIHEDELTAWCNSDAGEASLAPYFEEITQPDTALPDAEIDVTPPIEHTDEGPVLHLKDGSSVQVYVVGETEDMDYFGIVDEGVAGFSNPPDGGVTVHFLDSAGDERGRPDIETQVAFKGDFTEQGDDDR